MGGRTRTDGHGGIFTWRSKKSARAITVKRKPLRRRRRHHLLLLVGSPGILNRSLVVVVVAALGTCFTQEPNRAGKKLQKQSSLSFSLYPVPNSREINIVNVPSSSHLLPIRFVPFPIFRVSLTCILIGSRSIVVADIVVWQMAEGRRLIASVIRWTNAKSIPLLFPWTADGGPSGCTRD